MEEGSRQLPPLFGSDGWFIVSPTEPPQKCSPRFALSLCGVTLYRIGYAFSITLPLPAFTKAAFGVLLPEDYPGSGANPLVEPTPKSGRKLVR